MCIEYRLSRCQIFSPGFFCGDLFSSPSTQFHDRVLSVLYMDLEDLGGISPNFPFFIYIDSLISQK